ncbi:hypothetical protein PTSG_04612 [Salpingoeca rosetta]|uniref:WD repeat-containing protein 75 second beta-propeller domain-containing protein n=1 Tax=Salpingoeca rosetta (strain ATCC 50818 / BSB-021) TaxID=946362 RepID=F2U7X8_SALR5|nr:uncharacterized protein PTSG_04612 [Salpingoeca rosetta]EGD72883.1 hypothetical protein PTSG_04612 [Salpingoeca rosetta]|eukprot:XP_004994705.1 hypothetical protein PTSG_04612 [Salpingoeca rosetta]
MEVCGGLLVGARSEMTKDARFAFVPCENTVRVVALRTSATVRVLQGHSRAITQVSLNPANRLQVVTAAKDNTIKVWDYDEAVCLRTFKAKGSVAAFFFDGHDARELYWVEETHFGRAQRLCHMTLPDSASSLDVELTYDDVIVPEVRHARSWCYHPRTKSFLYGAGKTLHVHSLAFGTERVFNTSNTITVIATHDETDAIATGDAQGKVHVWYGCFRDTDSPPVTTSLHWHAHAVSALTFTTDGAYLLSGGEEAVFVMWQLDTNTKRFLPRLGAPIAHIAAAQNSQFYLVSLHDNSVLIINAAAFAVSHSIIGCRQAPVHAHQKHTVGLVREPQSGCVLTNGKQGMLQLYDIERDAHVRDVDVVGRQFVSRTFRRHISPTSVLHAAYAAGGSTLATVEYRRDAFADGDLRLKFWTRKDSGFKYAMNTLVEPPHTAAVTGLLAHPTKRLFVTTSKDGTIKLWAFTEQGDPEDSRRPSPHWYCQAVGDYNQLPCTAAAMSADGSHFVVACKNFLTLWSTEDMTLLRVAMLSTHKVLVSHLAFTADGKTIVLAARQHTMLFDVSTLGVLHSTAQRTAFLATAAHTSSAAASSTADDASDEGDSDNSSGEVEHGDVYAVVHSHDDRSSWTASVFRTSKPDAPLVDIPLRSCPKAIAFWQVHGELRLVVLDQRQRLCLFPLDSAGTRKEPTRLQPDTSNVPLYGVGSEDFDQTRQAYQRFFGTASAAARVVGATSSAQAASALYAEQQLASRAMSIGKTPLEETFAVPSHLLPSMRLLSAQFLDLSLATARPHATATESGSDTTSKMPVDDKAALAQEKADAVRMRSQATGADGSKTSEPSTQRDASTNSSSSGSGLVLETLLHAPVHTSTSAPSITASDFAFVKTLGDVSNEGEGDKTSIAADDSFAWCFEAPSKRSDKKKKKDKKDKKKKDKKDKKDKKEKSKGDTSTVARRQQPRVEVEDLETKQGQEPNGAVATPKKLNGVMINGNGSHHVAEEEDGEEHVTPKAKKSKVEDADDSEQTKGEEGQEEMNDSLASLPGTPDGPRRMPTRNTPNPRKQRRRKSMPGGDGLANGNGSTKGTSKKSTPARTKAPGKRSGAKSVGATPLRAHAKRA